MLPNSPLTPAERGVSALLLQCLSDRGIAERLVISHRTVECHISPGLVKTGCVSRLELAQWMPTIPTLPA